MRRREAERARGRRRPLPASRPRRVARRAGAARRETLLEALCGLLTHEPIVLLLDNFEDNLVVRDDRVPVALAEGTGRSASIREGTRRDVARIAVACRGRGALLITCRYAIAGLELEQRDLPPLNAAAVRRLLFRLVGLQRLHAAEHPRVLEFADALARVDHGTGVLSSRTSAARSTSSRGPTWR